MQVDAGLSCSEDTGPIDVVRRLISSSQGHIVFSPEPSIILLYSYNLIIIFIFLSKWLYFHDTHNFLLVGKNEGQHSSFCHCFPNLPRKEVTSKVFKVVIFKMFTCTQWKPELITRKAISIITELYTAVYKWLGAQESLAKCLVLNLVSITYWIYNLG